MKQPPQWQALMARVDALSLRERLFLFLSILLCLGALVDTLWLSPAQTAHKQLVSRLQRQSVELQALRDMLKVSGHPQDVGQSSRDALLQLAARTTQVNEDVRKLLPGTANTAPLAQALVHLLRRHEGLTLVRTAALAPEVAGPGNGSVAGSLPAGLTRQGVSLTVSGSYAELMRYVASLETDMPFVRWGVMNLKADRGLTELTLQLFLLGETAP